MSQWYFIVTSIIIVGLVFLVGVLRYKLIKTRLEREIMIQKNIELFKKQEMKSINAMIDGQEKERVRLARDLHDNVGSMLSLIKIHYMSAEDDLEGIENQAKSQYERANQLLDEVSEAVRKISHNMVSGTLTKFGLVPALKELKEKIEETKQLEIKLVTHGVDNRLDNINEIQLYRVIQELLNNVLKHAKAKNVLIKLIKTETSLDILFTDDGVGFELKHDQYEGIGLKSVKARIEEINGNLIIDSVLGRGTSISINIPNKK